MTCGKSSHIRIASHSVKSSPQKHSEITLSYWCTTYMQVRRRFYRNTSHQLQTAMEIRAQRSQVMHDLSVTKAHCNELVRISFVNNWKGCFMRETWSTANGPILQENEIWNVIIQLTCGLRAIHQANLACRFDKAFRWYHETENKLWFVLLFTEASIQQKSFLMTNVFDLVS